MNAVVAPIGHPDHSNMGLSDHTQACHLSLPHQAGYSTHLDSAEDGLSNKEKHISLALLVVELWTSKVYEHLSKKNIEDITILTHI